MPNNDYEAWEIPLMNEGLTFYGINPVCRHFHAPARRPHLCPKCNGERTVPLTGTQTSIGPRTCPTCLGEGVVWG